MLGERGVGRRLGAGTGALSSSSDWAGSAGYNQSRFNSNIVSLLNTVFLGLGEREGNVGNMECTARAAARLGASCRGQEGGQQPPQVRSEAWVGSSPGPQTLLRVMSSLGLGRVSSCSGGP